MRCSLQVSFVPWGNGRNHNVQHAWIRDWQVLSQGQPARPAQHPGSCQSWLPVHGARKCHVSWRYLTPCHSFQTLHLFFTFKSAPDAIFKKSHPTSPSSSPTLESNTMLLGHTGVMPTPPGTSRVLKTYLNNTYLPVLNFKINTCLPESFDR